MHTDKKVLQRIILVGAIILVGSVPTFGSGLHLLKSGTLEESLGVPVADRTLESMRGEGIPFANAIATDVGNNFLNSGSIVSTNAVSGSSFSHAGGIVNVIQNTGSNNIIQNIVQLNLKFVK